MMLEVRVKYAELYNRNDAEVMDVPSILGTRTINYLVFIPTDRGFGATSSALRTWIIL
jgi:hypothetical protein